MLHGPAARPASSAPAQRRRAHLHRGDARRVQHGRAGRLRRSAAAQGQSALVLPKTLDEKAAFDTCFDQFFSFRDHSPLPPADRADDDRSRRDDRRTRRQRSRQRRRGRVARNRQANDRPSATSQASARRVDATDATQRGHRSARRNVGAAVLARPTADARAIPIEINIAINGRRPAVNVHEIELFTQKGVYTRRIMEAMGHRGSAAGNPRAARQRRDARSPPGAGSGRRRDWLRERVRDYVEHQFLLHADVTGRRLRESLLRDVRLSIARAAPSPADSGHSCCAWHGS